MDPSQIPAAPPAPAAEPVRDQDKMMLFLAYFGIFSVVPYFVIKDSDYVHWHAKQGMTLCAASFAAWIGFAILMVVLRVLHIWLLGTLLGLGLMALLVLVWFSALVKAFNGERWRIPIVADIADIW